MPSLENQVPPTPQPPATAPKRSRSRLQNALVNASLAVVSVLLCLIAAEVVVRLAGWKVERHRFRLMQYGDQLVPWYAGSVFDLSDGWARLKAGITFQHIYDGDERGYFEPGGTVTYHVNALGFRGPLPEAKPRARTRRIVVLGDSFAFGEGVHWPDTFVARLNRRFASAASSAEGEATSEAPIECIDLGVPGTATPDQLEILRRVGVGLEPDLVVLVFTCNDFLPDVLFPAQSDASDQRGQVDLARAEFANVVGMYLGQYEPPRGLARWSRLYDLLQRHRQQRRLYERWVATMVGPHTQPARQAIWQQRRQQLRQMRDLCRERGSNFAVVLFPTLVQLGADYPLAPLHRQMELFCRNEQIPFVDLLQPLSRFEDRALWVHPTDHHPNERAQQIVAETLEPFLRRQLPSATHHGTPPLPSPDS